MDLNKACEVMKEKILSHEATEFHLEQFILNLEDGETPAMSVAMAMDPSDNTNLIGDKTVGSDDWG